MVDRTFLCRFTSSVTPGPATPTLTLLATSDTGVSNSDKITNDTTPDFLVNFSPDTPHAGAVVFLWKNNVKVDLGGPDNGHAITAPEEAGGGLSLGLGGAPLTNGVWDFQVSWRPGSVESSRSAVEAVTIDTTAAVLTTTTATSITTSSATLGCTTNKGQGKLYIAVTTSATPPSSASIIAGTGFVYAANQSVLITGAKTFSASGLTGGTTYYAHYAQTDTAGNVSTVLTSASFATSSGADVTAPTLSSLTEGTVTASTASYIVTTNEGNGTIFWVVVPTAQAAPTSAQVVAGQNAAGGAPTDSGNFTVTASGVQAAFGPDSGMSGSTAYDIYVVHRDAAGNSSTPPTTDEFTTASGAFAPATSGYHYWDFRNTWQDSGTTPSNADYQPVGQVNDLNAAGNHFRQTVTANKPLHFTSTFGVYSAACTYFTMSAGDGTGSFMQTINNIAVNAPFFVGMVFHQAYVGAPAYAVAFYETGEEIMVSQRTPTGPDNWCIGSAATSITTPFSPQVAAGALAHFQMDVNGAASKAKITGSAEVTGIDLGAGNWNNGGLLYLGSSAAASHLELIVIAIYIGPLSTKSAWQSYATTNFGVTI